MKHFLKILFWTAIVFICSCVFIELLKLILPLEIRSTKIGDVYLGICIYGIPSAILLTLTGTLRKKHDVSTNVGTIIATLFCSLASILVLIFVLAGSMCGWLTDDVLYENKANSLITIETRHYDCGATDTQRPNVKTYKITKFAVFFEWKNMVDTNEIDKSEWIRVKK